MKQIMNVLKKKKITIISGFKREIESLKQVEGKKLPNFFSIFFVFSVVRPGFGKYQVAQPNAIV